MEMFTYGIGAFLIICGLIGYFYRRSIIENGVDIEATVVSNIVYSSSESDDTYLTVFGYTVDDVYYEKKIGTGNIERFPVGSKVLIQYHRNNPKRFRIKDDTKREGKNELLLIAIGIIIILLMAFGVFENISQFDD